MTVEFDPGEAYPQVRDVKAAMSAGDWARCREVLDPLDASGRSVVMRAAVEQPGSEDLLRAVVAADPGDATAAAMLGLRLTEKAWRVRTHLRFEYVGARRFRGFLAGLEEAEHGLVTACGRTPGEATLWEARLTTARGLELGLDEAWRRYGRLTAADPHHLPGQQQMLQQLCPKWGGSWAVSHNFVRRSLDAAPPGAHQGALVAEWYLERWADFDDIDDGLGYLASPRVRAEIADAAGRSIGHPDFRRTPGWVRVMSMFAVVFCLQRDHQAAAYALRSLGPLADDRAWGYLSELKGPVRRYRTVSLAPGAAGLTWAHAGLGRAGRELRKMARLVRIGAAGAR